MTITVIGWSWNCSTKFFRSSGIDVKLTKLAKIRAPIRIVNSIAVVRALSTSTCARTDQRERTAREREHEGAERADRRAFGHREDAAVDAAHHQREEHDNTPDAAQGAPAVRPCGALAARPGSGIAPGVPGHGHHQQDGGDDAGDDAAANISPILVSVIRL